MEGAVKSNCVSVPVEPLESAGNGEVRVCKQGLQLRHKQFKVRNSVLTDLYEIIHIKTIYNVFTASFVLLFINIVVSDLENFEKLKLNISLMIWHLKGIEIAALVWSTMFILTAVLYASFKLWASVRNKIQSSECIQKTWDSFWIVAYGLYYLIFLCYPQFLLLSTPMAPITTGIIAVEQLRMMMKSHAFVRSNLRNVLKTQKKIQVDQDGQPTHPNVKHFLYFHFAPTLVYRDSYPRNERIRWKSVLWHFCEVIGIAFYLMFTYEQFLYSEFKEFWEQPPTVPKVLATVFSCLFPGLIFLIIGFYAVFHAWLNGFAELLRFGDRRFYEDWWTTTTFASYYRSWNLVVHEWLYEYLYIDIMKKFYSRTKTNNNNNASMPRNSNRFTSRLLIFMISALFHEYAIVICLRFFYPMTFILFGLVGVAFFYIPRRKGAAGNIFVWLSLSIGVAILLSSYCLEYYARKHCNPHHDSTLDFVIPRSWTCNATFKSNSSHSVMMVARTN